MNRPTRSTSSLSQKTARRKTPPTTRNFGVEPLEGRALLAELPGTPVIMGEPTHISTGQFVSMVSIGDLNGDRKDEILVSNAGSGFLSIHEVDGTGNFSVMRTIEGSGNHALADINTDGALDLLLTDGRLSVTRILLNRGDGDFQEAGILANTPDVTVIAPGDFNKDGRTDFALALELFQNAVRVYLQNPDGSFAPPVFYDAGRNPTGMAAGDVTGDRKADLIVAAAMDDSVTILAGHGDGSFTKALTMPAGDSNRGIALGDPDGDGDLEIVTGGAYEGNTVLLRNNGGSFTVEKIAVGNAFGKPIFTDLNGDGAPEIVQPGRVCDLNTGEVFQGFVTILPNHGGSFGEAIRVPGGLGPFAAAAGDLNGDGLPEIVAGKASPSGGVVVIPNRSPVPPPPATSEAPVTLPPPAQLVDAAVGAHTPPVLLSSPKEEIFDGSRFVNLGPLTEAAANSQPPLAPATTDPANETTVTVVDRREDASLAGAESLVPGTIPYLNEWARRHIPQYGFGSEGERQSLLDDINTFEDIYGRAVQPSILVWKGDADVDRIMRLQYPQYFPADFEGYIAALVPERYGLTPGQVAQDRAAARDRFYSEFSWLQHQIRTDLLASDSFVWLSFPQLEQRAKSAEAEIRTILAFQWGFVDEAAVERYTLDQVQRKAVELEAARPRPVATNGRFLPPAGALAGAFLEWREATNSLKAWADAARTAVRNLPVIAPLPPEVPVAEDRVVPPWLEQYSPNVQRFFAGLSTDQQDALRVVMQNADPLSSLPEGRNILLLPTQETLLAGVSTDHASLATGAAYATIGIGLATVDGELRVRWSETAATSFDRLDLFRIRLDASGPWIGGALIQSNLPNGGQYMDDQMGRLPPGFYAFALVSREPVNRRFVIGLSPTVIVGNPPAVPAQATFDDDVADGLSEQSVTVSTTVWVMGEMRDTPEAVLAEGRPYAVCRPLDHWIVDGAASHCFIATRAKFLGDPDARVFSFGRTDGGLLGRVDFNTTNEWSGTTHQTDIGAWSILASPFYPGGVDSRAIPATNEAVEDAACRFIKNQEYHALLGPNSNSAARAIADEGAGEPVPLPGHRIAVGESDYIQVEFRDTCGEPTSHSVIVGNPPAEPSGNDILVGGDGSELQISNPGEDCMTSGFDAGCATSLDALAAERRAERIEQRFGIKKAPDQEQKFQEFLATLVDQLLSEAESSGQVMESGSSSSSSEVGSLGTWDDALSLATQLSGAGSSILGFQGSEIPHDPQDQPDQETALFNPLIKYCNSPFGDEVNDFSYGFPISLDFSKACWQHDLDYAVASNKSRLQADLDFFKNMRVEALRAGVPQSLWPAIYFGAVRWIGESHFEGSGDPD